MANSIFMNFHGPNNSILTNTGCMTKLSLFKGGFLNL